MTVSPRRAQDGQQQSSAANRSSQPSDRGPSELPPTLFKLRNLNPESFQPSEFAQPEATVEAKPAEAAALASPEAPEPAAPPAGFADHPPIGEQPQPPDSSQDSTHEAPTAAPRSPFPTAPVEQSLPAGRTWMERVGSHALVLSMLLIVVAAAVLTGRRTQDPSELDEAVSASVGQEIRFDSREQTELPIPDHLQLTTPDEVAADHSAVHSPIESLDPRASQPLATAAESSIGERFAFGAPAAQNTATAATEPSRGAPSGTAPLSVSQMDRRESLAAAHASSAADPASLAGQQVDARQFYDAPTGAGATAVSKRTAMEDEALAVPTLEDLESSAGTMTGTRPLDGPQFSRTPFGITDTDLLLHLDELIQANSRSTTSNPAASYSAAGSPTSSN